MALARTRVFRENSTRMKGDTDIMAKQYKLTPQRLKELQDELTYLKTVREREVAEQIKEARSFGDLSENSEYDEAKNEQGKLYSRIAEVEEVLANYVVIEETAVSENAVSLGSQVTVEDEETGEQVLKNQVMHTMDFHVYG